MAKGDGFVEHRYIGNCQAGRSGGDVSELRRAGNDDHIVRLAIEIQRCDDADGGWTKGIERDGDGGDLLLAEGISHADAQEIRSLAERRGQRICAVFGGFHVSVVKAIAISIQADGHLARRFADQCDR